MTHLARVLAGFALVLGICYAAIAGGDRETVTPPPDAVAEGFFRALVTDKFDQAEPYITEEPADEERQSLLGRIESQTGKVDDVRADLVTRTDAKALVRVRLESLTGSSEVPASLSFDRGEWKLDRVP